MALRTPFKLTPLGLFHTIVSLVCVAAAFVALYQDHGISPHTSIGRAYLISLWITTLTGFPIFRHGKAGPPHVLGVLTVIALLVAAAAGRTGVFGRAAGTIETVSYSLTVLLLMVPTVTETLTRVPPSRPWVKSPDSPVLRAIYSLLLVLFLAGVTLQVRG
ncbi:MAG TPA: hypothetical protein VGB87_11180 [Vicinamibacteria bacterium]